MSKTYNSWRGMIERCKPERPYGKRGVTVCDRWRVFANFLEDMGERPKGKELDRKNPLGSYCLDNCCWRRLRHNRQYRRTTRLSPAIRRRVRRLRKQGRSYPEIARAVAVSRSCIREYFSGAAWGNGRQARDVARGEGVLGSPAPTWEELAKLMGDADSASARVKDLLARIKGGKG
jgi:hypothetical protein